MQGNEFNGLGSDSDLSTTRAVYKCWFGLELEPVESETRFCVQGKWTGENPRCGKLFSLQFVVDTISTLRKKLIAMKPLQSSDAYI